MAARPEIAEVYLHHFPRMGHQTTVVVWSREEPAMLRVSDNARVRTFRLPRARCVAGRLFQQLVTAVGKLAFLLQCLRRDQCDVIVVEDDVPGYLVALCIKRVASVPFVFFDASPDPEIMIYKSSLGLYTRPRLYSTLGKVLSRLEQFLAKHADMIFVVSNESRDNWQRVGVDSVKIAVIPNGAAVEVHASSCAEEGRVGGRSLKNGLEIIYVGAIDKLRRLDVLLRAFALLTHSGPGCNLLLVGSGNDVEDLRTLARHLKIEERVRFVGEVPYSDVPKYLALADVAVCPIPPIPIYRVSSPLKLFEYMAAAKPVLATKGIPECEHVILESGGGMLCSFDAQCIASALEELLSNVDSLPAMGRKGREWVLINRSYEVIARKAERELLSLVGTSQRIGPFTNG